MREHPYRWIAYAAGIGVALGLSIGWFAGTLGHPWGEVLILLLLAALLVWCLKQLAWARRMARRLRDEEED